MTRYAMVVDVTRCNGCYNCFLACRDEHCGNDFPPYSAAQPMTGHYWMRLIEKERGSFPKVKVAYVAVPCMQCEDPSCMKGAGKTAVYRRPDGIVVIDPEKAHERREILAACPYRVIYWNEQRKLPQKCTFCAHLLDRGFKEPRCVEACPTAALIFGDLDDPGSPISQLVASAKSEPLRAEYRMGEKVRYIGLPKRFVAGSLVRGDTDECAEGVTISLLAPGFERTTVSDNFGDFEFEGLAADTGYLLTIMADGYESVQLAVKTVRDAYCGEIVLAPRFVPPGSATSEDLAPTSPSASHQD